MVERVRNVIKLDHKRGAEIPQAEKSIKKIKRNENILKHYP